MQQCNTIPAFRLLAEKNKADTRLHMQPPQFLERLFDRLPNKVIWRFLRLVLEEFIGWIKMIYESAKVTFSRSNKRVPDRAAYYHSDGRVILGRYTH